MQSSRVSIFNQAVAGTLGDINAAMPLGDPSCFFSDGLAVPVKVTGAGKRVGKTRLSLTVDLATGQRDRDTLRLFCQPAL